MSDEDPPPASGLIFVGVDPGASGCIIALRGHEVLRCRLDGTERDIADFVEAEIRGRVCHGVLERVHSMPKQGVASSFKFGVSYGMCRALLVCNRVPFEAVTPGVWQKAMGCMSKGDKNVTKTKAQELFPSPGFTITHKEADALLLAEYCRRTVLPH